MKNEINKQNGTKELLSLLSLKDLKEFWQKTENTESEMSDYIIRGWLIDELEERVTEESFDAWLDSDNIDDLIQKD